MGEAGDLMIKKYGPGGQLLWVRTYADLSGQHMLMDAAGDLIVGGHEWNSGFVGAAVAKISPQDGELVWKTLLPGGVGGILRLALGANDEIHAIASPYNGITQDDITTRKLDASGALLWEVSYNFFSAATLSHYDEAAEDIDVAPDGRVAVTGWGYGGATSKDAVTVVYDAEGNQQWVRRWDNGAQVESSAAVRFGPGGSVYVGGTAAGISGYFADFLLIKYDAAGNQQWVRTFDGEANHNDTIERLHIDSFGNPVVVGHSKGFSAQLGAMAFGTTVLKYDPQGVPLWERKHFSGGFGEEPRWSVLGSDDSLYITADGGTGQDDFMTFKLSPLGGLRWEILHVDPGVSTNDYPRSIAVGADGAVVVTGRTPFQTIKYEQL